MILTDGSEVGRLGSVKFSMIFSSWASLAAASLPPCASSARVDTWLSSPVEVCGLCVGEAADDGASTVLLLVLEGDAWKQGGDSLSGVVGASTFPTSPLTRSKPSA